MRNTCYTGISDRSLARLKGLRRTAIRLIGAYMPLGFLFFVGRVRRTGMLLLMEILALTLVTLWHLSSAECPQCGQPFYSGGWQESKILRLGRECMHCNFKIDG